MGGGTFNPDTPKTKMGFPGEEVGALSFSEEENHCDSVSLTTSPVKSKLVKRPNRCFAKHRPFYPVIENFHAIKQTPSRATTNGINGSRTNKINNECFQGWVVFRTDLSLFPSEAENPPTTPFRKVY